MNAIKRSIAVLLIISIAAGYAVMPLEAYAQSEAVIVQNRFVQTATNPLNGRFSISTVEGSPYREKDQQASLLFSGKEPETSFTTFRVDGNDYIYGNDYSYKGQGSRFISFPEKNGFVTQSKCRIGNLEITQSLELNDNEENPNVGNVKISYTVENKGENVSEVGARILLDTKLGGNDGAPFLLPGEDTAIGSEKKYEGEEVPAYWRSMDSPSNPEVVGYGLIDIPLRQKPDKVIMAHWSALSRTKWDYAVIGGRQFSSEYNDFKTADSAVALYWNPTELKPGEVKTFETYYGLGELIPGEEGDFGLSLSAPDKLTVKDGKYVEQQFKITAEIDNSLSNSALLAQLKVALELPPGLELAEGETSEKIIEYIPKGRQGTVEWTVVPTRSPGLRIMETRVRVTSVTDKERTRSKYIILPGIGGELPQVYYQDYAPKLLYGQDSKKSIQLIGKGFNMLKDLANVDIYLQNINNQEKYYVSDENISIVDDNRLVFRIPDSLEVGNYTVNIRHFTFGHFAFSAQLGISNDSSLMVREYNILAISKSSGENYHAKVQDTEANLSDSALVIRGNVREVKKNEEYEVIPEDTATINSVVKYQGKSLQVYKEDNVFKIKGDGTLRLNTQIAGKKLDIKLFEGKFILDSKNRSFEPEPGYANREEVVKVGVLPLIIKSTKLDDDDGIFINADLKLPVDKLGKLFDEWADNIKGPLDNMHLNSNGVVYQGEVSIPFPKWKIGSFQSQADKKKVTLLINTKDNKYGLRAYMENKSMQLMDIETTLMFKDWVPDYLEFTNDYGNMPKPIGSTGMGLQKIGGGIYGISKLWEEKYPSTTLKATCDIVDLISPKVSYKSKKYSLITGHNLAVTLSLNGITLGGKGLVYFLDVANIEGEFEFDRGGYIKANLDLLDIYIAEAYLSITKSGFEAYGKGKMKFPGWVPFIGGETISSIELGISSEKVWGSTGFLGCTVGVTYYWEDNDFDFDVKLFGKAEGGEYIVQGDGLYSSIEVVPGGKKARVVYGSNFEKIEGSRLYAYAGDIKSLHMGQYVAAAELKKEHTINIKEDSETVLFKVAYEGNAPVLRVTKPDKKPYELRLKAEGEPNPNCVNQIIEAKDSASGKEERSIYIVVQKPESGNWQISSNKDVEVTAYNAKEAPKFKNLKLETGEYGYVQVNWELTTVKDSYVSLYLVRDGEKSNAALLDENIDASDGEISFYLPDNIGTGTYSIMAKVTREDFGFDVTYTEAFQPVKLADASSIGFTAEAVGNGKFRIDWEIPYGHMPYGYYLQVVDEYGNPDMTAGEYIKVSQGDILGGVSEDENGNPHGWVTNRYYNFTLREYEIVYRYVDNDGDGYNETMISEERLLPNPVILKNFFLPAPEPPQITVDMSSPDGTITDTTEMDGVETKVTNGEILQLNIDLDKKAELHIEHDESNYYEEDTNQYELRLNLSQGVNDIKIKATAQNGDVSVKDYKVICDSEAPYLMVESLSAYRSSEGDTLTVSGRTEANATVTIDGYPDMVQVNSDGSFRREINLSGEMSRTVSIKAADAAGNITSYRGEVLNAGAAGIQAVLIKPSGNEVERGAEVQLELYSKTPEGKEFRIDHDAVTWEIAGGEDAASVSESGKAYGKAEGEAIVKASYKISEAYSLEDAVVINVIVPKEKEPEDPEDPQDPKDPQNPESPVHERDDDDDKRDNRTSSRDNTDTQFEKLVRINPDGVTIVELPGRIRLEIPQGSLPEGTYISVKELQSSMQNPDAGNLTPGSSYYEIEILGNETQLKKPAKMVIHFDKSKQWDGDRLGIYRYKEGYNQWELVGGSTDMQSGTVTVGTDHFSIYGVFENSRLTVMKDMKNHWARDAVSRLVLKGLINGVSDGKGGFVYNPDKYITRAEFAKLLAVANGFGTGSEVADLKNEFKDWDKVPEWAKPYLSYCYRNKWINGSQQADGRYMYPGENITRAEAAAMLGRTLSSFRFQNYRFTDKDEIPKWAEEHVKVLSNLGIMVGSPDNSFRPNDRMTRAEGAALFDKYLKFKSNE